MKKPTYYTDKETGAILIFSNDVQIIPAGKHLCPSYLGCEVTAQDHIFSEGYDLHFFFHKDLPQFSFYPVPELLIFAIDSLGGSFCSTNMDATDRAATCANIYYLDHSKQLHWLAPNMVDFLSMLLFQPNWKEALQLPGYVKPKVSEEGKRFLAATYEVPETREIATPATEQIRIFPSLAAAQAALPFVDPAAIRPIEP